MPGPIYRFACPSWDSCLPEQSLERQSQDILQMQAVWEARLLFSESQVSGGITEAKIVKSSNVRPPKSDIFRKGDSTSKVSSSFSFAK